MPRKYITKYCVQCGKPWQTQNYKSRFCSNTCSAIVFSGPSNGAWKGGRYIDGSGYVMLSIPGRGHVPEHRWIMEQHLDRELESHEIIHHKDHDKSNNDIDNLELTTRKDHMGLHQEFHKNGRWSMQYDYCQVCGKTDSRHDGKGVCHRCAERLRPSKRK